LSNHCFERKEQAELKNTVTSTMVTVHNIEHMFNSGKTMYSAVKIAVAPKSHGVFTGGRIGGGGVSTAMVPQLDFGGLTVSLEVAVAT
jgi:hypothetical protein